MLEKGLPEATLRIVWDGLGSFRFFDVPVLFPGSGRNPLPHLLEPAINFTDSAAAQRWCCTHSKSSRKLGVEGGKPRR